MGDYPKYSCPFEGGEFYHVYNTAVGKEKLFCSDDNYRFFLDQFRFYTRNVISLNAFCLLSNHFHFLIKVHPFADNKVVPEQFRKFLISYSKSFNKEQKRRGSLFDKHLKRVRIETDEQLLWTIYYIHRNPFHHRITSNFKGFKWSSFQILISNKPTKLKRDGVLALFHGKEEFIKFHDRNIEEDILNQKIKFWEP